jgi:predicted lipid-binding transport protein (Tim44 family)
MKTILMALLTVFGLTLAAESAEAARRLGGGQNLGRQREMIQPAPKAPAQQAPPVATPAPQQPKSGMSKWLGPLAGLALGAGLASLFMNNGFAGALGGILMVGLIIMAVILVIRMLRPKPRAPTLNYATLSGNSALPPTTPAPTDFSSRFGGGRVEPTVAELADRYPPGFDAEQFLKHAKMNFTQLQAINNQGDLAALRDFMTPQLFADVTSDIKARGETSQKLEVATLEADVIEVVTERDVYVASVRFKGTMRDAANGPLESFSEVWHLQKPINGRTGWLVSGIQQD